MANKIKTSPTKKQDTKTTANTMQAVVSALQSLQKSVDTLNATQIKANVSAKEADSKSKEMLKMMKGYEAKRKELEEKRKEDKWQNNLNLAKGMTDAVMPADRRADFGQIGIGSLIGMDPAVVKLLGIDKVGAQLWNSMFGWNAIEKRHENSIKEQKLNEEYGISAKSENITEEQRLNQSQIKNNNQSDKIGRLEQHISKSNEKTDKNGNILTFDKRVNRYRDSLGKFKKPTDNDTSKNKEKYGSVVKRETEDTKLLKQLVKNTKPKKTDDKKEKEEKEKGGLFSKIMGFAKKLIFPMLAGLLLNAFKPVVKNFISGLFSREGTLGEIGQFVGGAVADMLPGAVAGFMLTKSLKGALIGAALSYGWTRITALVNDAKNMFNGEQAEINTVAGIPTDVLHGMITGALLGAKFGGLKGAGIGALIGGGAGLLWSTVKSFTNTLNATKEGKYVPPAEICGVPLTIATGLIGGASIGMKFGGIFPGAVVGALIGGAAGTIAHLIQKYLGKTKASEKTAEKDISKNEEFQQLDKDKEANKKIINDPNASKKEKMAAYMKNVSIEKGKEKAKAGLAGFNKFDKNNDGILDEEEQKYLDNSWFKSKNSMEAQERMKKLQEKGQPITKEAFMESYSKETSGTKNKWDNIFNIENKNMSTTSQITNDKQTEKLTDSNEKLIEAISKLNESINDKDMDTKIINNEGNNDQQDTQSKKATGILRLASLFNRK